MLAIRERTLYHSMYKLNSLYKELLMLSGMSVKPSSVTTKELDAFIKAGGSINLIKSRKVIRNNIKYRSSSPFHLLFPIPQYLQAGQTSETC